jgi:MFS transporter, ACS family, hexuronate transporter
VEDLGLSAASLEASSGNAAIGKVRWIICGLLFLSTTINYVDRQVIGILKPTLMDHFKWTNDDYGYIIFWFQVAYAVGSVSVGRIIDRIGVRFGYALVVFFWSLAAIAHAAANGVIGFSAARFGLGIAEGGNFPGAIKTVSEWFPKKERALTTGLFNSGSSIGALLTPAVAPWLAHNYGWQAAFIITGALGLGWLFLWIIFYKRPEDHPSLTPAELAYIRSDPADPPVFVSWPTLLRFRAVWGFVVASMFTSPVWWFILFWVPGFLNEKFHLSQTQIGLPVVVIYLGASVGSIFGGWLSSTFLKNGYSLNASRKLAMLICALFALPVCMAPHVANPWTATILITLVTIAHQGSSANYYTIVSDTMPRFAVSSVVGMGTMSASIVSMPFTLYVGALLTRTKSYSIPFAVAAGAYLAALLVLHLIVPKLEPVKFTLNPIEAVPPIE